MSLEDRMAECLGDWLAWADQQWANDGANVLPVLTIGQARELVHEWEGAEQWPTHNNRKLPPHNHTDTSIAAAREIVTAVANLRADVYAYIRAADQGATDGEIQAALGMDGNTERPRRCELVEAGLVVDSGIRRESTPGSERNAIIWEITKLGEQ